MLRINSVACAKTFFLVVKLHRIVLKESLAYYVSHGTAVYCGFLDATKAFDRVNYCKLFRLLMKKAFASVYNQSVA